MSGHMPVVTYQEETGVTVSLRLSSFYVMLEALRHGVAMPKLAGELDELLRKDMTNG